MVICRLRWIPANDNDEQRWEESAATAIVVLGGVGDCDSGRRGKSCLIHADFRCSASRKRKRMPAGFTSEINNKPPCCISFAEERVCRSWSGSGDPLTAEGLLR